MSRWSECLSIREQAHQVVTLISVLSAENWLLPCTFDSVRKSLVYKDGYVIILNNEVIAYAQCRQGDGYHSIHSVAVKEEFRGQGFGTQVLTNRLEECWRNNSKLDVILACSKDMTNWYAKFGFEEMPKDHAPESIRGGRSQNQWAESDRVWMRCTKTSYDQKVQG